MGGIKVEFGGFIGGFGKIFFTNGGIKREKRVFIGEERGRKRRVEIGVEESREKIWVGCGSYKQVK